MYHKQVSCVEGGKDFSLSEIVRLLIQYFTCLSDCANYSASDQSRCSIQSFGDGDFSSGIYLLQRLLSTSESSRFSSRFERGRGWKGRGVNSAIEWVVVMVRRRGNEAAFVL